MNSVRMAPGRSVGRGSWCDASIASNATRQRPPTRRAGSRPLAIQRWTDRVDVPSRRATSLGLSSSAISSRVSHTTRRATSPSVPPVRQPLPRAPTAHSSSLGGVQAGDRFASNAANPSRASSLTRWRAITRAVCHFAEPWPRPRTSRTMALAARAAVGPEDRTSPTAASTAASSAASPSTTSWTRPIRWARTASNRRPPGNSARAWVSPILATTNGAMTAGRMPEAGLGEPEPRAALGDDQVRHRAQAHPAAEGRALDPRDDRHRARVDRLEHVGHGHRVLLVALDVERHRRAHPGDVGAGAERRPVAGQDDGPELGRVPRARAPRTSFAARR